MSRRTVVANAKLFDSRRGRMQPSTTIVIEGERIVHVTTESVQVDDALVIDAGGRVVVPGLIDAHVHVTAVSHDVLQLAMQPPSLITAQSKDVMQGMLLRGFTSVRDAAGADFGLREAVARGIFAGPRLYIAGHPISQTGGHADIRPMGSREIYCACAGLGILGAIADGVPEVRRAAREQIRNGADHIKIMAGGGVASPNDPIDGTQFSVDELRAAVEEAEAANLYVLAHAYSPRAITRAVQAGVRSIEHGNLLDEASARIMKQHGAYLVPTLATYEALGEEGTRLGWSASMLGKLQRVLENGSRAVSLALAEGIPIALGSDLLGHMHSRQSREFMLRATIVPPLETLRSATWVAAELMNQTAHIGSVAAGAFADLLIIDGDPSQGLGMFAEPEAGLLLIMQGGQVRKDRLDAVGAHAH